MNKRGSTYKSFTRVELVRYVQELRREIKAMTKAINRDCYDCMGKSWRACELPDCPLYPFAPKRIRGENGNGEGDG